MCRGGVLGQLLATAGAEVQHGRGVCDKLLRTLGVLGRHVIRHDSVVRQPVSHAQSQPENGAARA